MQVVVSPSLPVTASSRSSVLDSHSSTGDPLPSGEESCCLAVRAVHCEASEMVNHLKAKKEVLLERIRYLEHIRSGLRQEIRRLSDLAVLLHQSVEFWKLGCLQGDMWRECYAILESSLVPSSSGLVPADNEVRVDVPLA